MQHPRLREAKGKDAQEVGWTIGSLHRMHRGCVSEGRQGWSEAEGSPSSRGCLKKDIVGPVGRAGRRPGTGIPKSYAPREPTPIRSKDTGTKAGEGRGILLTMGPMPSFTGMETGLRG